MGVKNHENFFLHKSKVYHVIYLLKLQNHVYYTFKCVLKSFFETECWQSCSNSHDSYEGGAEVAFL